MPGHTSPTHRRKHPKKILAHTHGAPKVSITQFKVSDTSSKIPILKCGLWGQGEWDFGFGMRLTGGGGWFQVSWSRFFLVSTPIQDGCSKPYLFTTLDQGWKCTCVSQIIRIKPKPSSSSLGTCQVQNYHPLHCRPLLPPLFQDTTFLNMRDKPLVGWFSNKSDLDWHSNCAILIRVIPMMWHIKAMAKWCALLCLSPNKVRKGMSGLKS